MDWDDAYTIMSKIPRGLDYPEGWARDAAAYREQRIAEGQARLGISYGDSARQAYDLFLPEREVAGLCVFVHGGYWVKFHRDLWSQFSEGTRARGWAVAIPSYDLCPDASIVEITQQIAAAITHASDQVGGSIVLVGHSAGGHLVARICVADVLPGPVAARLQKVMPISPVADLRPMLRLEMNAELGLDAGMAEAESPALQRPMDVPVSVWLGRDERPVFLDQARWLAQAWSTGHVVVAGKHHLDVIDALCDPNSAMINTLLVSSETLRPAG